MPALPLQLLMLEARPGADIHTAFATLVQQHGEVLLVSSCFVSTFTVISWLTWPLVNTIAQNIPVACFADAEGWMSYGNSSVPCHPTLAASTVRRLGKAVKDRRLQFGSRPSSNSSSILKTGKGAGGPA